MKYKIKKKKKNSTLKTCSFYLYLAHMRQLYRKKQKYKSIDNKNM